MSAGVLSAQVAETATEESFKTVEEISAIDFLMKGGVFLIPIVLLLFYTTYVAVERFLYIRRMTKQNMLLLGELQTQLNAGSMQGALDVANRDLTAYGSVIKEGVQSIGQPIAQIEGNMEKVANIEIGKMYILLWKMGSGRLTISMDEERKERVSLIADLTSSKGDRKVGLLKEWLY